MLSPLKYCLALMLSQDPQVANEDAQKILDGEFEKTTLSECAKANAEDENLLEKNIASLMKAQAQGGTSGGASQPPK